MKKIFVILLIIVLNIFLLNNLFAAELSERDKLSKTINSAWNSYKNIYEPWTDDYIDAKKRYDDAMTKRDALDKAAEKPKEEPKNPEESTEDAAAEAWTDPKPVGPECWFDVDEWPGSIKDAIDWCLAWSALVDWQNVKLESWFWTKIKNWVNNIALYLWVFAVWSIVYWGLMMTLSSWEEEKVNKAKDIIKWGIIWFLGVISASAIINLVVKIMYSL